jgi:hypothetical protein
MTRTKIDVTQGSEMKKPSQGPPTLQVRRTSQPTALPSIDRSPPASVPSPSVAIPHATQHDPGGRGRTGGRLCRHGRVEKDGDLEEAEILAGRQVGARVEGFILLFKPPARLAMPSTGAGRAGTVPVVFRPGLAHELWRGSRVTCRIIVARESARRSLLDCVGRPEEQPRVLRSLDMTGSPE